MACIGKSVVSGTGPAPIKGIGGERAPVSLGRRGVRGSPCNRADAASITVPDGYFFLAGDNHAHRNPLFCPAPAGRRRRRRACRVGRCRARAEQGRQAAGRAGRQAGLDRPAVGPDGPGRQQPAQQLEVHDRQVQRQQSGRRQVRGRRLRQQGVAGRDAERAQARHRPGHPLHHPGQQLRGRPGAHRRDQQVQRAQSRQGSDLPERGCGRPGPDQQQVQLLALPLRRRYDDEDGGDVQLHEGPEGHPQGLHPRPELFAWRAGRQVHQGRPEEKASRHRDRRRRSPPHRQRARLLALHRQDQGLGRRHRRHRQLGLRSVAAR